MKIKNAQKVTLQNINHFNHQQKDLKLIYHSIKEFQKIADFFGIMSDLKKGIPRTAYQGTVVIRYNYNRIFIVPSEPNLTYEQ